MTTSAARGQGRAHAPAFAAAGARLVISDRPRRPPVARMTNEDMREFSRIDVLVNNGDHPATATS